MTPLSLRRRRLALAVAVLTTSTVAATTLASSAGAASSTVTIVGTSDVSDSGLIVTGQDPSPLVQGFQNAYPQYTLNYIGKGTGAAIDYAEAGEADGLIVHAESLENQFVAAGYSYEPFGRAIFYGDYVLLGPADDPADVATLDPHNVVGALEDIAAAGAQGTADFVSRGGTPGTTVEEHALWALGSGTTTCTVSQADGGGSSPSTTTGDCPDTIDYPSWYHVTGLTQGPNVEAADACNFGHGQDCYVLTDRGTFDYLESQGALSDLKVVTRDNAASAPGGQNLLINSFHAYAVNPAAFAGQSNVSLNTAGAEAFLNYLTSPAGQHVVASYLANNPADSAPFTPDAAPKITATSPPHSIRGVRPVRVRGQLSNPDPGTPALADQPIDLYAMHNGAQRLVESSRSSKTGQFDFTFRAKSTASYSVRTESLTQLEKSFAPTGPPFSDELALGTERLGLIRIVGDPRISQTRVEPGRIIVTGTVSPSTSTAVGELVLLGKQVGRPGGLHPIAAKLTRPRRGNFTIFANISPGQRERYAIAWAIPGEITTGRTSIHTVDVP